ncbi:MAG: hypothetical protein ABL929_12065 [Ferruginibacter sp.]
MKKVFNCYTQLILFICCFTIFGCKKDNNVTSDNFTDNLKNQVQVLLNQTLYSTKKIENKASLTELIQNLDYSKIKKLNLSDNSELAFIPFTSNKNNQFISNDDKKLLTFSKNKISGKIALFIITLSETNYRSQDFDNWLLKKSNNLNGTVKYFDLYFSPKSKFNLENGILKSKSTYKKSKDNIPSSLVACGPNGEGIMWGSFEVTIYADGSYTETLLDTWCQLPNSFEEEYGGDGGGSGGTGGGSNAPTVEEALAMGWGNPILEITTNQTKIFTGNVNTSFLVPFKSATSVSWEVGNVAQFIHNTNSDNTTNLEVSSITTNSNTSFPAALDFIYEGVYTAGASPNALVNNNNTFNPTCQVIRNGYFEVKCKVPLGSWISFGENIKGTLNLTINKN